MKKIILGSIMLAGLMIEGPAVAANWTGFYAGVNAGAGINNSSYNVKPAGCLVNGTCGLATPFAVHHRDESGTFNEVDFIGGGQIGYDYDFNNGFVLGGVADFDGNTMNETARGSRLIPSIGGRVNASISEKMSWFGTVRAKLGWAFCNWMLYGTGGFAYGNVQSNTHVSFSDPTFADAYSGSQTTTQIGWTAGAGVAYMFNYNWSVGLEYLYLDLNNFSYTAHGNVFAPTTASHRATIDPRDNLVRFTLNYKFCL
ncbi:MAG: outer membrane protein [Gammaproteobacteria bacterium]